MFLNAPLAIVATILNEALNDPPAILNFQWNNCQIMHSYYWYTFFAFLNLPFFLKKKKNEYHSLVGHEEYYEVANVTPPPPNLTRIYIKMLHFFFIQISV